METPVRKLQVLISEPGVQPEIWALAQEAHNYNLENYTKFINELDKFVNGESEKDIVSINLLLQIWILAPKNGPDSAKRIHLLETMGATFEFAERFEVPKPPDDEEEMEEVVVDKKIVKQPKKKKREQYLWLHMTYGGFVFRAADLVPIPWRDEINQRLALHREYAEKSNTITI